MHSECETIVDKGMYPFSRRDYEREEDSKNRKILGMLFQYFMCNYFYFNTVREICEISKAEVEIEGIRSVENLGRNWIKLSTKR